MGSFSSIVGLAAGDARELTYQSSAVAALLFAADSHRHFVGSHRRDGFCQGRAAAQSISTGVKIFNTETQLRGDTKAEVGNHLLRFAQRAPVIDALWLLVLAIYILVGIG